MKGSEQRGVARRPRRAGVGGGRNHSPGKYTINETRRLRDRVKARAQQPGPGGFPNNYTEQQGRPFPQGTLTALPRVPPCLPAPRQRLAVQTVVRGITQPAGWSQGLALARPGPTPWSPCACMGDSGVGSGLSLHRLPSGGRWPVVPGQGAQHHTLIPHSLPLTPTSLKGKPRLGETQVLV